LQDAFIVVILRHQMANMEPRKYILNKEAALQKLHRMVLELAEDLHGDDLPVVIIGIRNSGTIVAEIVGDLLKKYIKNNIRIISVTMDKSMPNKVVLSEAVDLNDVHVIVTDDVTNSGKALMYALKPLLDFHPKTIQTLVLVERMHKMYPVKPDYVGLSVATTLQNHIQVEVLNGEIVGAYVE
jgi:pyrimidine operon attenuation protein / uracil phosphoribosyltransferase